MKIRFISDIHYYLNSEYSVSELLNIFASKKPADVTLIAGDASSDIAEMYDLLNTYFKNEKIIFINGNHCVYHRPAITPIQDINKSYQEMFNGQWKFLENNYTWLNENIAVIGCIGWTDFLYGHQTKSQYVKEINAEKIYREKHKDTEDLFDFNKRVPIIYSDNLPEDPVKEYDELQMGNKESYRGRRMKDAIRHMNDYNYGKIRRDNGEIDILRPLDTYNMHRESIKAIKRCYNEIIAKNPNAIIILMTHHPFTKKCENSRFKGDSLNAAFMSNHDNWLKQFKNIKYYHCGHVHNRFFDKIGHIDLICNPMGYLYNYENIQDKPFDINYMVNIKTR